MTTAGAPAATWGDAVAACVIGADRAEVPALTGVLDGMAAGGPGGLLAAVAALGAWRMAGAVPSAAGAVLVPPMEEAQPECSGTAAAQLESILSASGPRTGVCREWCRLAAAAGVCAPPGLAGALFTATRRMDWVAEADRVLGGRLPLFLGRDGAAAGPSTADWTSPDLPRRVAALRLMRADPAAGRAALAAVWKDEAADARAAVLAALEAGLGGDDEPFLEERLDDRSGKVRAEAARLLARVPGSRWQERMRARAAAAVQFRPGGLLSRDAMTVTLPAPDDASRRDGLDAKGAGAGAALLRQLAMSAPLSSWMGGTPARWIRLAMAGDWAEALVPGWTDAAARERDAIWLAALLDTLLRYPNSKPWTVPALQAVAAALPAPELEAAVLAAMRGGQPSPPALLQACRHDWSANLTRAVLGWAEKCAAVDAAPGRAPDYAQSHAISAFLDLLADHGDPQAAGPLSAAQADLPEGAPPLVRRAFDEAAATLRFRQAMHQEFAR